jgi:hypothetical protein
MKIAKIILAGTAVLTIVSSAAWPNKRLAFLTNRRHHVE